jgi:Amt family ammonium transporter
MKNVMDFSVGSIVCWAFGFALAYGGSTLGGFVAHGNFFFNDNAQASTWFFQVVFAATATTIISGALAGRVKFKSYLIYTPFITGFIYPIVTHWVWGGGWLSELGFFDFAGSGVVHMSVVRLRSPVSSSLGQGGGDSLKLANRDQSPATR